MRSWLFILMALAAFVLIPFAVFGDAMDAWVGELMARHSGPALAALLIGILVLDVVLPIPSSLVASYACQRFAPWCGLLIIAAGISGSTMVAYVIGRSLGSAGTQRRLGDARYDRAFGFGATRSAGWAIALSRAIPVVAESVGLLAGALRWPIWTCLLWTVLAGVGVGGAYALLFVYFGKEAGLTEILLGSALVPLLGMALGAWFVSPRQHPTRPEGERGSSHIG